MNRIKEKADQLAERIRVRRKRGYDMKPYHKEAKKLSLELELWCDRETDWTKTPPFQGIAWTKTVDNLKIFLRKQEEYSSI